jgi:hypothetical protein
MSGSNLDKADLLAAEARMSGTRRFVVTNYPGQAERVVEIPLHIGNQLENGAKLEDFPFHREASTADIARYFREVVQQIGVFGQSNE